MVDFREIVSRLEMATPHGDGRYYSARCVFHADDNPSMLVFRNGWFRCMACGKTGSLEMLWKRLQGQVVVNDRDVEPVSWTPPVPKDSIGMITTAHDALAQSRESLGWYLKQRGVDGRIEPCQLGWVDGWYTIPIFNKSHEYRGYVMRASPHVQEATGLRFTMPPKQPAMLYVPDWHLLDVSKCLFVVFGMFDALALSELRLAVCTTTAGKSSFDPHWLDDYRKMIYVVPDKGEEQDGLALAGQLGWRGRRIKLDYPDGLKDPADFVQAGKSQELLNQLARYA